MRVCVITFKYCWRDEKGAWMSDGGFPLQMAGIRSLFDGMTMIMPEGSARGGGIIVSALVCLIALGLAAPLPLRAQYTESKDPQPRLVAQGPEDALVNRSGEPREQIADMKTYIVGGQVLAAEETRIGDLQQQVDGLDDLAARGQVAAVDVPGP